MYVAQCLEHGQRSVTVNNHYHYQKVFELGQKLENLYRPFEMPRQFHLIWVLGIRFFCFPLYSSFKWIGSWFIRILWWCSEYCWWCACQCPLGLLEQDLTKFPCEHSSSCISLPEVILRPQGKLGLREWTRSASPGATSTNEEKEFMSKNPSFFSCDGAALSYVAEILSDDPQWQWTSVSQKSTLLKWSFYKSSISSVQLPLPHFSSYASYPLIALSSRSVL